MSAFLITGSAGSGKSTIIGELQKRGFTAYDTDSHPGVSRFEDNNGNPAPWPVGTIDWDLYQWNWNEDAVMKLLDADYDVFLGGVSTNQSNFYKYFDKIFVLTLNDETLRHRILSRTDKDYGKDHEQLEGEISYRATRESDLLKEPQSVAIDATLPLAEVVDAIVAIAKNS